MPDAILVKKNARKEEVPKAAAIEAGLDERIKSALEQLPEKQAAQIRALLLLDPNAADNKQQIEFSALRKLEGFKGASEEALIKIFTALATHPEREQKVLREVLNEPNFTKLNGRAQAKVLELAEIDDGRMSKQAAKLLRLETSSGLPLLTNSFDIKGSSLLDNFCTFARSTPHSDVSAQHPRFVSISFMIQQLAIQVATPSNAVGQGNKGACGAAAIQDLLCRRQPAEYVRIVTGLISDKTVDTRGGTLTAVTGSLKGERDDFRSAPERLFQSALLHESKIVGSYSYEHDGRTIGPVPFGSGGMAIGEMQKALNLLFEKNRYEELRGDGRTIHDRLKQSGKPGLVGMHWEGESHALVYVRSDDEYVYLKDPNGPVEEQEPGTSGAFRPARETPRGDAGANTRMLIADFEKYVFEAHAERDTIPPDYLMLALSTGASLSLMAEGEARKLIATAASVTAPIQQEIQKVENELTVAIPAMQRQAERVVDTAVDNIHKTVRFTAMILPPPPNPVEMWNQLFQKK